MSFHAPGSAQAPQNAPSPTQASQQPGGWSWDLPRCTGIAVEPPRGLGLCPSCCSRMPETMRLKSRTFLFTVLEAGGGGARPHLNKLLLSGVSVAGPANRDDKNACSAASQGCWEGQLRPQRERKPSFPSYTSHKSPGGDAREERAWRQDTVSAWGSLSQRPQSCPAPGLVPNGCKVRVTGQIWE